jgi:hypothetical protein
MAPERDAFDGPSWVDRWLLPFVREPTLWPVLLVVIGHAMAIIAPLLLLAVRDRSVPASVALLGLVAVSGVTVRFDLRRSGRPAALSWVVLVTWLGSGAVAWLAHRTGAF